MKKQYVKLKSWQQINSLPGSRNSRAMRFLRRGSACFKTDGSDPADPADPDAAEKAALLGKIKDLIVTEMQAKGLQNKDDVVAAFASFLDGMTVQGIKKFHDTEAPAMQQSIKNMAGAIEKLKATQAAGATQSAPSRGGEAIKRLLEDKGTMDQIQEAFRKGSGKIAKLTVQAAVPVMTTGNTIDEGDIPEDILESFSVDTFVKKRRPKEYIFDIVSRRTVPEITEHKTWLSEGDEQGAFAITTEGEVKPLMSKTLVRNYATYDKVTGKRVYTEEFVKFRKEAYQILEDLFNDQLLRNYAAILTTRLIGNAAAYVGTSLDGLYVNPTDFHAIGAVAAQMETLEFVPDLLIVNPQDKWRIGLQQDNTGQFFLALPMVSPTGSANLLGFRVFTTNRIAVGTFILAESGLFKVEDEPVQIRLGYGINVTKNVDGVVTDVTSDVDTNRFRIIAETFFRAYIDSNFIGSFVQANWADVKEALTAAPAV
jgi:hypothetical protein